VVVMRRLVIPALVAVLAYTAWTMWPSEEARIRARLDDLGGAVSMGLEKHETQMARLARVARLRQFLAPDLYLDVGAPYQPIEGRDVVLGMVAKAALPPRDVIVRFVDVQVTIDPAGGQAIAYLTAEASSQTSEGAREIDARELQLTLRKVEGEWIVTRVEVLRTLQ
jgi:hypothetical protein